MSTGRLPDVRTIIEITEILVLRTPPDAAPLVPRFDYGFPSEHIALSATAAFVAAWPWTRLDWASTVRRYGIAVIATMIAGVARVVLLIEYPSDTIAAAWTLIVCLTVTP